MDGGQNAQENSNGDPTDSGFETYTLTRKMGQLVTTPTFRRLYRGDNSGEIMLLINAVEYARFDLVRYAALQDGVSGPWTEVDVPSVKSAFKVSGLTPRTRYVFQVQAVGPANRPDWSSSCEIICV